MGTTEGEGKTAGQCVNFAPEKGNRKRGEKVREGHKKTGSFWGECPIEMNENRKRNRSF